MNYRTLYLLLLLIVLPVAVSAQTATMVPNPPDIPPQMQSGESLEPEITIIDRQDDTVTEYRAEGVLYKVKIQPAIGPAYYYVDLDGDGRLEFQNRDPYDSVVPQWIMFRW